MTKENVDIPPCICSGPGYCPLFRQKMEGRFYELCSDKCPPENPCRKGASALYRKLWLDIGGPNGSKYSPMKQAAPSPTAQPPGLFQQVKNVAVSLVNYARAGLPQVSEEVYKTRRATCDACEQREPTQDRCLACGCFLSSKLLDKLKMQTESCPLKKW